MSVHIHVTSDFWSSSGQGLGDVGCSGEEGEVKISRLTTSKNGQRNLLKRRRLLHTTKTMDPTGVQLDQVMGDQKTPVGLDCHNNNVMT
ncbi:hypothetical protein PoB_006970500 [Plakobranchus ocellatus]|uniref:Uncharacterized protein n=1 Tax=Plakobranchus ocellatus TaxID=259542 RepID=A0AAV4DGN9_9GAST|nr:hypothetical protein PoB_006970500 [Plakobranchus ocellatus]